ncbi:Helicase associated domain [Achromobacter sp. 2789STDY5608633]|jgi:hypothetical protein|uniref:helicase associated domain-containing protein n=1 Tax=Achromobacter sp. 2789STDY5608633 TaxID=1806501 RepID=UPI0006C11706|nr:helicase associated domain-containing protein [Achromobacter sp. 2789STDY5608633]CUJ69479.1 Helicase associated domain [Achromobacter sp. 2789STDY5608633]
MFTETPHMQAGEPRSTNARDAVFMRGLAVLQRFYAQHGHTRVAVSAVFDDFALGRWVAVQRAKYQRQGLDKRPDLVMLLEELPGWTWKAWDWGWNEAVQLTRDYLASPDRTEDERALGVRFAPDTLVPVPRELQGRLPPDLEVDGFFQLGKWIAQQRRRYRDAATTQSGAAGRKPESKKPKMTREHLKTLKSLPHFLDDWKKADSESKWKTAQKALRAFVKKNGHAKVPRYYEHPQGPGKKNFKLGMWVYGMRTRFKQGKLPAARIEALEEFEGWVWSPRNGDEKETRNG